MSRLPAVLCGLFLICLLLIVRTNCSRHQPTAPLTVEMGFDPTSPKLEDLERQAAVATQFLRDSDRFILRATDQKTTIISTTRPESDTVAFKELQDVTQKMVPITDLANYFEAVATAAGERRSATGHTTLHRWPL